MTSRGSRGDNKGTFDGHGHVRLLFNGKSGDVERQSEFVRYPDLFDQQFKPGPKIRDRLFLRRAIANSADAWPQESNGSPHRRQRHGS